MITPIPSKHGVGFMSKEVLSEEIVKGYRYEQVGHFHNYYVTPEAWRWPATASQKLYCDYIIDGFSPNLNKELHVGHLRNLALANSLRVIASAKAVALLGTSLGVKKAALDDWNRWTRLTGYKPAVYYDTVLPTDIVETREPTPDEITQGIIDVNEGPDWGLPRLWDGPNGPVVVIRSDGRPLYAFYDLCFAKLVGPTHYITGHEQKEHFRSLGLGDKHLPMGLVLGEDGKKIKSRSGDALSANEAFQMICEKIGKLSNENLREAVAWNILAWNFLHAARESDLKFDVEKWTDPDSPGMYITYTYARILHALPVLNEGADELYSGSLPITLKDANLLGLAEQTDFYLQKSLEKLDPAPLANYTHDLARALGVCYERERINGGRQAFIASIFHAMWRLEECLTNLGMFVVNVV